MLTTKTNTYGPISQEALNGFLEKVIHAGMVLKILSSTEGSATGMGLSAQYKYEPHSNHIRITVTDYPEFIEQTIWEMVETRLPDGCKHLK